MDRRSMLKRSRHSVTEWNLLSQCPRAYEWTYIRPKTLFNNNVKNSNHTSKPSSVESRELGTEVHRCLELGDEEGLRKLDIQSESVLEWMHTSPLMKQAGRGREVWTELAFEVPLSDEVLVGSIDRLVCENGRYQIIDFKVMAKEKSDAELIKTYQTQLFLYAEALSILEPQAKNNTEIWIVVITTNGVRPKEVLEVRLPVSEQSVSEKSISEDMIGASNQIILGKQGQPKPSFRCRYCSFQSICEEGRAFFTSSPTSPGEVN